MSGNIRVRAALRERGSRCARHHICAATQQRGSIHERGTIANIDVNEAATNETIRVAQSIKKIIYVCNGWHGRYKTVLCILCKSQMGSESLRKLYDSNFVVDIIGGLVKSVSSALDSINSRMIDMDINQFKKTIGKFCKL